MRILNRAVQQRLTKVSRTDPYTWARLIPEDTQFPTYEFLINPESLEGGFGANYGENPSLATEVQRQQYFNSYDNGLTIPNARFQTPCNDRSLESLYLQLLALTRPIVSKGVYAPPVLSFFWSKRRVDNLALSAVKITEDGWASGIPTRATYSLTFIKVPESGPDPAIQLPSATPATPSASNQTVTTKIQLTQRQMSEGAAAGAKWLRDNVAKLAEPTKSAVKSGKFTTAADIDGTISALTDTGSRLGTVGTWDGKTLNTSKNTVT